MDRRPFSRPHRHRLLFLFTLSPLSWASRSTLLTAQYTSSLPASPPTLSLPVSICSAPFELTSRQGSCGTESPAWLPGCSHNVACSHSPVRAAGRLPASPLSQHALLACKSHRFLAQERASGGSKEIASVLRRFIPSASGERPRLPPSLPPHQPPSAPTFPPFFPPPSARASS